MWQYYQRFMRTLWDDFRVATEEQIIGALLAIAIFAFQNWFGLIPKGAVHANLWSIAWPYVGLVVGIFLWHLARTPNKLDQRRAVVIEDLATKLEETTKANQKYLDEIPRLMLRAINLSSGPHSEQSVTHF
jgi:hypothetical protein